MTDRKEEIVDTFIRLVDRFGIDKTTMQDIAKEVGISVGVIYKDFKNKDELIDEYVKRLNQHFLQFNKDQLILDQPAEELLRNFILGMFRNMARAAAESRGFWQFVKGEETFRYFRRHQDQYRDHMNEIVKIVAEIIERGVREGIFEVDDTTKTADLFIRAFSEYGKQLFMEQRELDDVLAGVDDMFSLIIRGIKKAN